MDEPVARAAALLGERAARDAPLGARTTYRVGGAAALLSTVESEDDLAAVRDAVAATGVPVLVVGKGSNLLVDDAGFAGLAVVLGDGFSGVEIDGTTVRAGGAASLPVVARRTGAAGLTGFEWAVGVPGSIGGAVRMNAGGHGSDIAASLRRVRVVDLVGGEDGWVPAEQLELRYRHSSVRAEHVVVMAELELAVGDRDAAEAELDEIVRWRRANQPGGQNAGSVFTNPAGDSAGRLIDAAGAKGLRVGTAMVSPKHANFVIADAGGRADDVWALMGEVQQRVWQTHGVWLEPETRLVGYEPNPRPPNPRPPNPRRGVES
jgi:UDP-N-acetylmuramate dehydrogenase